MRLLIVPMTGGRGIGPICRALAVANSLKGYCNILFLCAPKFVSHVQAAGFDYVEDIEPTKVAEQGNIIKWNDAAYAMGLCQREFVTNAVEHQLNIVKAYSPDVIFTEYNLPICAVSKILNIPLVSTVHWADTNEFSIGSYPTPNKYLDAINAYNDLFQKYGLPIYRDVSDMVTAIPLLVAPTISKLQPKLEKYNPIYTGELLNKEWETNIQLEREIADGAIYVYLTTSDMLVDRWFPVILRELGDFGAHIYVVVNDKVTRCIEDLKLNIPHNIHLAPHYPGLSVMKHSNLVIHAGSANVIAGALLTGTPSVIVPLNDGERLYNAIGIERYGAGKIIRENDFLRPGGLQELILRILGTDYYRNNSITLGAEIAESGGSSKIAEVIKNIYKAQK